MIAGARDHSLAILKNGTVWAWGLNQFGNLGIGNTTSHHLPVQVKGLTEMIAIAGGRDHSLAIKKGGAVYAWGWNAYGQIGDGTTVNRHLPKHVAQLTGVAAQITAGANHSVVRRADGSVWAFGQNSYGQIGDGTSTQRKRPTRVVGGVASIGTGRLHTLVVKTNGTIWAWGANSFGQLGDGSTQDRHAPVRVGSVTNGSRVAGGVDYSVAVVA